MLALCLMLLVTYHALNYAGIIGLGLPHAPYKLLSPSKNILGARRFFSLFVTFFHFHRTLFRGLAGVLRGLAGALRESRKFFKLSFCTFTCLSTNSLISSWISAKFVSAFLQCMLYLSYYFQPEVNT